ncbi:beta-1,4-galactosyltransferase 7-like [Patella vulgata]|uniref:beta-1,4-galactosyltransferase 7-like n=1 Tax=Patella vulgata TaxID=6465 RepID=UPI00217F24B5|nr:beta-1,4-galactosyltransferase 7-like [Patella vulgata]
MVVCDREFNRASLINIGFLESKSQCDYIAMHDVDLLPLNPALSYSYPENGAFHVAAPELHPLYHYKKFVGGILLVKGSDFEKLNGLSNKYWGWGLEDDEFFVRMKKLGIMITRPVGITTGNQTFKHVHDRRRTRDKSRFFDQKEKTRRLDKITGVNSVDYTVDSKHELTIDDGYVTVINVKLKCDLDFTPWCLMKEDHEVYLKLKESQANKNKIKKK